RPSWEQDAETGKWRLTRDRWHTGFVEALGHGGLLGQVEGRTVADVLTWLATTSLAWRKCIGYVAIDMSATYRAAIRIGLAHATVVVDHFHVVQLANKMLSMVRRRTTAETRGRRGRTGADRHQVGNARWNFLTWCTDSDIPEVRQLATTVDRWRPEIAAR